MQITFLGNYPPRRCGIATFTEHLADGMARAAQLREGSYHAEVVAVNDGGASYDYPPEVTRVVRQHERRDYIRAAEALNRSATDLVVLQHEFGIFGGDSGDFILAFAERLRKPLVVTMHTVLRQPSDAQRLVTLRLARLAQRIVVMSRLAVRILRQVYRVPQTRIARIAHGAPAFDYERREAARRALDLTGRHTVLTFGLLGRGKGIETAIEALPALKAVAPDFCYVLLGKTHPHVVEHEGEAYREALWARVEELGLADNVRFADEYVGEGTLADYLLAADTYVLPYPNEAQITSGTLSYAVAAGCAVVSTPFWHAKEILDDGRGRLFPFNDHAALGQILAELAERPEVAANLRDRARDYGRHHTWTAQGKAYLELAGAVRAEFTPRSAGPRATAHLPALDLQHIRRLSDDTGILQHATHHLPNPKEGYCLDDNVRALIFCAQALEDGGSRQQIEPLLDRYLSLVHYLQLPDGRFHNFIGYDRGYLDRVGSEDSFGRTVWALGRLLASPAVSQDHKDLAWDIYLRARPHVLPLRSLRAVAFSLLGICALESTDLYSEGVREFSAEVAGFLAREWRAASDAEWRWFEPVLTYGNAILPLAALRAHEVSGQAELLEIAREATGFLERYTFTDRMIRPIGCHTFMRRGGEPSRFDQQPLDAMAMVYLYAAWYEYGGDERDRQKAIISYSWFTGLNDLGLPLFHAERGSCFDGLMAHGVNRNQGAESTLAFWMARNRLAGLAEASERDDDRATLRASGELSVAV